MGILERVNCTLKCEFIFREEPKTKAELSALCAEFRTWCNTVRPHTALIRFPNIRKGAGCPSISLKPYFFHALRAKLRPDMSLSLIHI